MTGERRYDDSEARQIFEVAAAPGVPASSGPSPDGLTLSELQDIAIEVGLSPERIAQAAATLAGPGQGLPRRTQLGMPVSAGHVVELPRAPNDREWDLLVSALRETFGAGGNVSTNGGIREWTNGNLHAYVEPTEDGHRLRMGTLNGGAMALNFGGMVGSALGLALAVTLAINGRLAEDGPAALAMFLVLGSLAFLTNAVRLPSWARKREGQMQKIASRAVALLSEPPSSGPEQPSS